MKQHNIDNWEDFPEKDALLLFAQRFEECLFDYSLDSYKARALNTRTRCVELKDYIQQVQKASLSNNVLIPVVEELAESIQKDEVARSLLSHKAEYLGRKREWEGASLQQIETQVDLALTVLADTYEERLINHLKMLIEDGRRKKDIISATGDLVVEWMSKGYSSDYLFYQVRMYFYYDDRHIDSVECFDEFVEKFQHQTSEWTVIIRANENIGVLADLFDDESSVSVVGDAPEAQTESTQERGFLRKEHDGVYVIIDGVESLDASAAHSLADSQLEALVSIARYHIHREPFEWEDGGLVYDEDGDPTRLQGSTPPIEKHPECYLEELPDEYRATLEAFGPQKLDWESWQRLARVLRLHGSAVRSDSAEGQLFSLWTALESLLPLTKFESRIDQTVDSIKPLLCRGYPKKLIDDIHESLSRCLGGTYKTALNEVEEAESALNRCGAMLALESNEAIRRKIYGACDDQPLLRHRVFRLHEMLSSSDTLLESIEAHAQRVEWHLHRIYRSRNLLVHSGRTLPFHTTLIENLHFYVDRILSLVENRFRRGPTPDGLDEALLSIQMEHRAHVDSLRRHGGRELEEGNWRELIYGPVPKEANG